MDGHITAFIEYLEFEKGLSLNTRAAYRRDLSKFMAFVREKWLIIKARRKSLSKTLWLLALAGEFRGRTPYYCPQFIQYQDFL